MLMPRRVKRSRRPINKEWREMFDNIRKNTERYGDELSTIKTIEMYERVDDKPADLIVACNILEHLPDVDEALKEINRLAIKGVLLAIECDAIRGEEDWRTIIERRMTVIDWLCENGRITCTCSTGMKINGPAKIVAAMSDETRWEHVLSSMARVKQRIVTVPAHDKRCILACYGPSLKKTWPKLQEEFKAGNCTLVSMSGAHEFLIEKGIIPDYHVEADPRPRTNIKQPRQDIKYLIASSCHPMLFDKLEGYDVSLWHVSVQEHVVKLVDHFKENKNHCISGGGSVGVRSISLMYAMGHRKFSVYGMDCSFEETEDKDAEGKPIIKQWAAQHVSDPQPMTNAICDGVAYPTSPVLMSYAGNFFDTMQRLPDAKFRVYGEGLLPAMCRLYWKHTQLEAA